jgi:hypothetical protein
MTIFQDYIDENRERLLFITTIKRSKELRQCFSCDSSIKINAYFSIASTLLSNDGKVVKINQYVLCKKCVVKVEEPPLLERKIP